MVVPECTSPFSIEHINSQLKPHRSLYSTPLYQILTHALPDPQNKTKFTLIFANLSEDDILLREEFDDLKKKYSDKFNVVYALDKAKDDWKGASVSADLTVPVLSWILGVDV